MKRGLLWTILAVGVWVAPAAAQRFTAVHDAVDVMHTSTPVVGANNLRNLLLVVNDSDTNIYCKFGESAVAHQGILISANGGGLLFDVKFSSQALNCITLSGDNKVLLVTQGQQ